MTITKNGFEVFKNGIKSLNKKMYIIVYFSWEQDKLMYKTSKFLILITLNTVKLGD